MAKPRTCVCALFVWLNRRTSVFDGIGDKSSTTPVPDPPPTSFVSSPLLQLPSSDDCQGI